MGILRAFIAKNNPSDLTEALIRYGIFTEQSYTGMKMIHCHSLVCLNLETMKNTKSIKFSNKICLRIR